MKDLISKYKIILGSASPRRKELLSLLGIPFSIELPTNSDESYPDGTQYNMIPETIALGKSAGFGRELGEDEILITADTMVFCPDHEPLGKPKNPEDAIRMLHKLSGKTHEVITGVAIRTSKGVTSFSTTTEVTFKELSDKEIEYYISNYAPYDKAGAYAIQEWIGAAGITSINGSYFNVVGLPVQRVYEVLRNL